MSRLQQIDAGEASLRGMAIDPQRRVIMSTKDEPITMGLDRWNAMLTWWGVRAANGNGRIEDRMKRIQAFTADLQQAYGDSYSRQVTALLKANERIVGSFQQLFRCQQPQELVAAESELVATLLEGASRQAGAWAEMMQKVQDCCAAMAREAADDLRQQAGQDAGIRPPARRVSAAKHAGKHPAQT
jgi:hypothetical protein